MRRGPILLDRLIAWAPVLLLAALAALTFWLDAQVQQQTRHEASARHEPDSFVDSFRAVSYDAEGHLRQALAAKRAVHYPDDESLDFIEPLVVLTDPGKPRISVTADKGVLTGDHETISLSGHVHALRDAETQAPAPARKNAKGAASKKGATADVDGPSGPVSISTEYLRIVPKRGHAVTDKAVTIEEPRGIINAVGMELDNQAKTLKLKSGVHGTLQPAPPNR